MTDITLTDVKSGYNLSTLNDNFDKVESAINEDIVHNTGGNNTMRQALDMNGYPVLNASGLTNPSQIGYEAPILYESNILFGLGDNTKTVDRDGIVYAPLPSELPFTTSGTWAGDDENKFFVVQGITVGSTDIVHRVQFTTDILVSTTSSPAYGSDYYDSDEFPDSGCEWIADGTTGTPGTIDRQTGHIYNANGDGYLYKLDNGEVNVAHFGVKDDGTDQTLKCQDLLLFCHNLYFPKGHFVIRGLEMPVAAAPNSGAKLRGANKFDTRLTSLDGTNVINQGVPDSVWATGGTLQLRDLQIYGSDNYAALTPTEGEGLLQLHSVTNIKVDNIEVTNAKSNSLYVKNIGYSQFQNSNFLSANLDCVFLESTSAGIACTSTNFIGGRVNSGGRSSFHLQDVFNINIIGNQCESSNTALLITGIDANNEILFTGNYVEATTGDYDIDFRTAAGSNLIIINNYLFGTPNIQTLGINTNGHQNFTPIQYSSNRGGDEAGQNLAFTSMDWLEGSRSTEGVANVTLAKATFAAQQSVTARFDTENDYGVGLKSSSVQTGYHLGMLRNSEFDGISSNNGFITQRENNNGAVNKQATESYAWHIYGGDGSAKQALKCSHIGGDVLFTGGLGNIMTGTPNAADAALKLLSVNTTGRSINAAGTINASGADYAEYVRKSSNCGKIEKGQVVGINSDGEITDRFDDAHTFMIKSTNPSYVGGDIWHNEAGEPPAFPKNEPKPPVHPGLFKSSSANPKEDHKEYQRLISEYEEKMSEYASDMLQHEALLAKYESNLKDYEAKVEEVRANFDRIAFCGIAPLSHHLDCSPGDLLEAFSDEGKIGCRVVDTITRNFIGKVWKIEDKVYVKV